MKLRMRKGRDKTPTFFIDYRQDGVRRYHFLRNIHDGKTAEVAFAEFQVRMAKGQAGLPTNQNLSISQCLKSYRETKEATCGARHIAQMKSRIAQMEAFFGKDAPVRSLKEKSVNAYRVYLRGEGDCAPTINKKIGILKAAIDLAVKQGKIARNSPDGLENLSDARKPAWRFLKPDEVDKLISVLREGTEVEIERKNWRKCTMRLGRSEVLHNLCLFLLNTGARLGEALALTWRDVDLERKIITLHTTKRAARGRAARPRFIPINQTLLELLQEFPKGAKVLAIRPNNIRRRFEKACAYAGIGHCRIHDLRHTFASGLAMAGIPLNTIRELLGHTTLAMTLRYAHLCPNVTAEAVEVLSYGAQGKVAKVVPMREVAG